MSARYRCSVCGKLGHNARRHAPGHVPVPQGISRQRAHQIDHVTRGLCMFCRQPRVTSLFCAFHLEGFRERQRDLRRIKRGPGRRQYHCSVCGHPDHNARRHRVGVLAEGT